MGCLQSIPHIVFGTRLQRIHFQPVAESHIVMAAVQVTKFELENQLKERYCCKLQILKQTLLGICVRLFVFVAVLIVFEVVLIQFLCAVF